MTYKVYPKKSKEIIMTFDADSLERAIIFASQIKQLSKEEFLKLFTVKESNNGK